jgi:Ni/Fe-hydrogenase subunit HybB-like protein
MAVPAANAIYDDDTVEVNQALSKLSKQVIRQRPQAYVHWLVGNTNHARQQLTQLTVFDKGTLLVGLLLIYAHLSSLVVGVRRRSSVANTEADVQHRERHIVFWIAILFALAKTSLVVLVEPANDRYMTPAMVFLPAVLAVFTAQYAQRVLCPRVG